MSVATRLALLAATAAALITVVAVPAGRSSHGAVRDKSPAWSPDGTLIAFAKSGDDFEEIWVTRTDGTDHRKLSPDNARETQPAWSPDGRRIAFASFSAGNWDVYVMDADGSNRTSVISSSSNDTAPTWSPDGSQLAYQRADDFAGPAEIRAVRADGSGDRTLTSRARNVTPSWSPDGNRIVFTSTRDGNRELYVMNADGSGVRRLTATPDRREDDPSWSPDGARIAFAAGDDVRRDIYVVDAEGSDERRLTRLAKPVWWPRWSPDGARLVFFDFPYPSATIYLVNADGLGLTTLFGRLGFVRLTVTPKRPIAGRAVTVALTVAGAGAGSQVACRATLAGHPLAPVARSFSGGRARCVWRPPRSAKGKLVRGSIAVSDRGARVAGAFLFRVR